MKASINEPVLVSPRTPGASSKASRPQMDWSLNFFAIAGWKIMRIQKGDNVSLLLIPLTKW
jgi:hypothetical protein